MQILDGLVVRTIHEEAEPTVQLLFNGLARKLVTLQTLRTTSGGIRMARRRVTHTQNAPRAFRKRHIRVVALHLEGHHVVRTQKIVHRQVHLRRLWGQAPHIARLAFPIVDKRPTAKFYSFQPQHGFPLGGIQVLSTRFRTLGRPLQSDELHLTRGNAERRVVTRILPTLTRGRQLFDGIKNDPVGRHLDRHPLTLDIRTRRLYLDIANLRRFVKLILNPAGLVGTINTLFVHRNHRGSLKFEF